LPLTFSSTYKVGLGLWNHPAEAIFSEGLIYMAGIYLFFKNTKPLNKKGIILIWILIVLLIIFYIMNLISPPPPSSAMVSWSALLLWLFVLLGYKIEKNRIAKL